MQKPRVVIVGAGFGGLWAAKALAGKDVDVLLIDKNNYHAFWPLLYQVAAAELEAEQIIYPVRHILRKRENVNFVMGEVRDLDPEADQLLLAGGANVAYDYLVLAPGSASSFFGIPGAAQYTFPLKTMEDGIALRNHILRSFEKAILEPDGRRRRQLLNFVVVGGGPTGVEYAGALAELVYGPLCRDYQGIEMEEVRITLVEMMDRLLVDMPEKLGRYAQEQLQKKGVKLRLNTAVTEVGPGEVALKDEEPIATETVVWTAGVRGVPLAESWGLPLAGGGRVRVEPGLYLASHPQVYVVGDLAAVEGEDGDFLPMLAPVAMQEGEHAARNILLQIEGGEPRPFHYRDRGTMATIGRNAAVAHLAGRALTGFTAWVIWLVVHLLQLIGFRNRLMVLINWAWAYLFFERAVRLILPFTQPLDAAFEEERPERTTPGP